MSSNNSELPAIGQRIRECRTNLKLTQQELGQRVNTSRSVINYWENGSRDIKTGDIVLLADVLGVTTDYILGRTNDPNPQPCAVDELGLSPEAIEQIKHIARYRRNPLNYFLASEYLPLLLENFKDFQEVAQSIKEDTKHFNETFEEFGISAPIDVIKYAKTYKYQENREYLQNTAILTVVREMEANVSDLEWFVYCMEKDIQTITDDYLTKNGL